MKQAIDLANLLPTDKYDVEKAEALVALGFPAVEPILPSLLEWVKDGNWPVARVLLPFLANVGTPLAPHLHAIFLGNDDTWKYFVLCHVVGESRQLASALTGDLNRLINGPSTGEQNEGLHQVAQEIRDKFSLG